MGPFGFLKQAWILGMWGTLRKGPGGMIPLNVLTFLKTDPSLDVPDIQMHFLSVLLQDHGAKLPESHCFSNHICQLRPESRGYIELQSSDPNIAPKIFANYLTEEKDIKHMIEGVNKIRKVFNTPTMKNLGATEIQPGSIYQTDNEIDEFIRNESLSVYHPIGTCKMGNGAECVVDKHLKVKGIRGLRVADASIFPTIISGNTNATCNVVGAKCADLILKNN